MKRIERLAVAVAGVIALVALLAPIVITGRVEAVNEPQTPEKPLDVPRETPKPTTEQLVRAAFPDDPVMVRIAWCESKFRQFEADGSVNRGDINPKDVGVFQVNEYYHAKTAKRLGMDLYTKAGNIAYAKWLYAREGTTPWNWSKGCWA